MANHCGAKTRAGEPCKGQAMANGKCRMHGGASTGPKDQTGNTNAATHGIYQQHLTEQECEQYNSLELGAVDHELRLTRIRLARALVAERNSLGLPELDEETENEGGGLMVPKATRKHKMRDYVGIIDRLTARIESLEKTRLALGTPDAEGAMNDKDLTTGKPDEDGPQAPIR